MTGTQLSFPKIPAPRKRHDYSKQLAGIVGYVGDGQWRSLSEIEEKCGRRFSQTGISARIRDLRSGAWFGWSAERKVVDGKNFYRVMRA